MEKGPLDEIWKAGEESLKWLEDYQRSLPKVIRTQDVQRAFSVPGWLDEEHVQKRAENRERVAQQRAERRATDPDAYKKHEREARARRREVQRLRRQVTSPPLSVPERSVTAILKAWLTDSAATRGRAGRYHAKVRCS